MSDTETAARRTTSGAYRRLTPDAAARATALAETDEIRASRLGVSRSTYYRMLRGETDTPLSIAAKVAEVLGMSIDAAFGTPES
jgi:DNA-binding XRE family transcriptional regulator